MEDPDPKHSIAIQIAYEPWKQWFTTDQWISHIEPIIIQTLTGARWLHPSEISIYLTNAEHTRELNHTYRGQDKPTNVLSFPLQTRAELKRYRPGPMPLILGDIVLCFETVLKETEEQHKRFLDHVLHLLVHGCLHLLGYDHENPQEAIEMEALEVSILSSRGIANPYQ
jgi:probable rRNA maturation factor